MGSHLIAVHGKEFEIRVKKLPGGKLSISAYQHLPGQPLQDLERVQDEIEWIEALRDVLEHVTLKP